MVRGESGIMAVCPPDFKPNYEPSKRLLTWPNGAIATTYSAEEPDVLRGPQHTFGWLDELAAYKYPETWDNFLFGLRLGTKARAVITTTPKPTELLKGILKDPLTVVTRGSSYENRGHLAESFWNVIRKYEGTRIGRQELLAELLDDVQGALWTLKLIDSLRVDRGDVPPLARVVIAIDPAVTSGENSDETGIIAIGISYPDRYSNQHLYVLEDASGRYKPVEWAKTALRLFVKWDADKIVAEVNNGGDLVAANIHSVHAMVPFRAVRASRGKIRRAEPVATLYERGLVHHVREVNEFTHPGRAIAQAHDTGHLSELENQMVNYVPVAAKGETIKSPDRMDALVWGAWDLAIEPELAGIMSVDPHISISPY